MLLHFNTTVDQILLKCVSVLLIGKVSSKTPQPHRCFSLSLVHQMFSDNQNVCAWSVPVSALLCVTSVASFSLFYYTSVSVKVCAFNFFQCQLRNFARLMHQMHSPLLFQSSFKMKNFPFCHLKNRFTAVPTAQRRCNMCICYFLFLFGLLSDVCGCFHGNIDIFHLLKGFKERQSCKKCWQRGQPLSSGYIFYMTVTYVIMLVLIKKKKISHRCDLVSHQLPLWPHKFFQEM